MSVCYTDDPLAADLTLGGRLWDRLARVSDDFGRTLLAVDCLSDQQLRAVVLDRLAHENADASAWAGGNVTAE